MHENLANAHKSTPKYRDPDAGLSKEEWYEREKVRIEALAKDMFGDETSRIGDALNLKEGVAISNDDMLIRPINDGAENGN